MGLEAFRERIRAWPILGLDSGVFIYQFEDNRLYAPLTTIVFDEVEAGRVQAVTSVLAAAEVLTGVKMAGNALLLFQYRHIFAAFPNLTVAPVDMLVVERASDVRSEYNLRMPDAILVATALVHHARGIVTNDRTLQRVRDLDVLVLEEYVSR